MKRLAAMVMSGIAALGVLLVAAPAAQASEGRVVVFSTEVQALDVYDNPVGCQKLPLAAHVITNETDAPITTYADPLCLSPGIQILPGYGSHVAAGTGSFSADS